MTRGFARRGTGYIERTRLDDAATLQGTAFTRECDVNIKVVIHAAEEGGYWAEVPALPGCVSQGETVDELLANVREAVQAWFEAEEPEPPAPSRGSESLSSRFGAADRQGAMPAG
jgi:predicted RNase H-like HicB family nuclease